MLNFRKMAETDLNIIAAMEADMFSDAWSEQALRETSAHPHADILIAFKQQQILGYVIFYHVLDEGEIARIAVAKGHRRQGVGRALLDETCRLCKELKITTLQLEVRESNQSARSFYENYGFNEDGLRKNFYQMPQEHAVLMSKSVG